MPYWIDENMQPYYVEHLELMELEFLNPDRRIVGLEIREHITISTVFLSFHLPQLWETMLSIEGGDELMYRYDTYKEALEGHENLCNSYL